MFESYREDPLCQAVERAVEAGLVVVTAAGNMGKTEDGRPIVGGIISPGNTPGALTVGALNTRGTAAAVRRRDGELQLARSDAVRRRAEAGARGAGQQDRGGRRAAGSYLATTYPERIVAGCGANGYIEMSGTSMASAVVAGAAALLLDANPSLSPADTKLALQLTSSRVAGAGLIEAGAGQPERRRRRAAGDGKCHQRDFVYRR